MAEPWQAARHRTCVLRDEEVRSIVSCGRSGCLLLNVEDDDALRSRSDRLGYRPVDRVVEIGVPGPRGGKGNHEAVVEAVLQPFRTRGVALYSRTACRRSCRRTPEWPVGRGPQRHPASRSSRRPGRHG